MNSPAQTWTNSLLRVTTWELRRAQASRLFWIQVSVLSVGLLCIIWLLCTPGQFEIDSIAGTSPRGLLTLLPILLVSLVLLLPFLTADGVTRDQQRRTHELFMATALPTRAYVWGRYLASLLISLGLALLLLVLIVAMGGFLHLTVAAYPLPQLGGVLLLWAGMVVPAVILVSNCSFALSTLLPGPSLLIKLGLSGIWVLGALVLSRIVDEMTLLPAWYGNWDPTSVITAHGLLTTPFVFFGGSFTPQAFHTIVLFVENQTPDPAGWFIPHLVLTGLGLGLVLIAALAFQRTASTRGGPTRRKDSHA